MLGSMLRRLPEGYFYSVWHCLVSFLCVLGFGEFGYTKNLLLKNSTNLMYVSIGVRSYDN